MTVDAKPQPSDITLECPYTLIENSPMVLPDDITACLRPATKQEIEEHKKKQDSRNYLVKLAEKVKDLADRTNNSARIALNFDFRDNLKRTIYDDPYLSLHKIFGREFYISRHPVVIKAILKHYNNDNSEKGCFHIREGDSPTIDFIREVFKDPEITYDDFILLASKKPTKEFRKFLLDFFNSSKIKRLVPEISSFTDSAIQKWFESGESTVNVTRETKILASSVMSKLFLGHAGPYEKNYQAVDHILAFIAAKVLKQSISEELKQQVEDGAELLKESVQKAMNTKNFNPDHASLVESMIANKEFNERQVKIMTFTLFVAGQENTASLMNYAILKCAQSGALQKLIRAEMHEIINEQNCSVGEAAVLSKKIKQVIVESLRMLPPAYTIGRVVNKDLILEIQHTDTGKKEWRYIEPGTRVNPCPTFAARHESLVHNNPDAFDYKRFCPEDIPPFLPNLPWSPFGSGPDTCPAWSLAYHETIILLGTLLFSYDIATDIQGEPEQVGKFACTTAEEVNISLKRVVKGVGIQKSSSS